MGSVYSKMWSKWQLYGAEMAFKSTRNMSVLLHISSTAGMVFVGGDSINAEEVVERRHGYSVLD